MGPSRAKTQPSADPWSRLMQSTRRNPLSMAFHELATNAVKYGAFSVDNGHIDVSWEIDGEKQLSIRWRESGVAIEGEPVRRGFGS